MQKDDTKKKEEVKPEDVKIEGFSDEQNKLAKERAEQGVCVTCGQPRWYCGGEFSHKRKHDLGQE
jgi:hypothetical protein